MKIINNSFWVLIFCFCFTGRLNAQDDNKTKSNISISLEFGQAFPGKDLAQRFGNHQMAGTGLYWYHAPTNIRYGLNANYLFGVNIKEDVISSLRNDNQVFLGVDNNYGNILLRQRGFLIDAVCTKTFGLFKKNKSSGLELGLGVGLMQHKIRIQVETNNVPLLLGEAVKGYDKNSVGPSLKQIMGFKWRSINTNANVSLLFEITEGFTKPTQALDFNTLEINEDRRFDVEYALKLAYYLPLKSKVNLEEVYY